MSELSSHAPAPRANRLDVSTVYAAIFVYPDGNAGLSWSFSKGSGMMRFVTLGCQLDDEYHEHGKEYAVYLCAYRPACLEGITDFEQANALRDEVTHELENQFEFLIADPARCIKARFSPGYPQEEEA